MKIISPYKDYYDYVVGTHGIDDAIVYHRNSEYAKRILCYDKQYPTPFEICVCNTLYTGLVDNDGNIIWDVASVYDAEGQINGVFVFKDKWRSEYFNMSPVFSDLNIKYQCPIVLRVHGIVYRNPILSQYNFGGVLKPKDIYIQIYNWLINAKDVQNTDNRPDVLKIEAAGFDKKTSFRNM